MFGSFGLPELLIILVLALVVFGGGKLPGVGKAIGESIRGFKDGVRETKDKDKPEEENS